MTDYMLTAIGTNGYRDIQVNGASDIRDAIDIAERVTGCLVSHGRGGVGDLFRPGIIIDADTGQATHVHNRAAKPEVTLGPPEVIRALAMVMGQPNTRSNNSP